VGEWGLYDALTIANELLRGPCKRRLPTLLCFIQQTVSVATRSTIMVFHPDGRQLSSAADCMLFLGRDLADPSVSRKPPSPRQRPL
jgi:hypothetical protein